MKVLPLENQAESIERFQKEESMTVVEYLRDSGVGNISKLLALKRDQSKDYDILAQWAYDILAQWARAEMAKNGIQIEEK
jgi:hypothetical protein